MWEMLTKHGRLALQDAQAEAQQLGSAEVLPEHLLLTFTQAEQNVARNTTNHFLPKPVATHVLEALEAPLLHLREQLLQSLPRNTTGPPVQPQFAPIFTQLEASALKAAAGVGGKYIGTETLLLGLMDLEQTPATQMLLRLGLTKQQVQEKVIDLSG